MGNLQPVDSRGMTIVRTIITLDLIPPAAVSDGWQRLSLGIGVFSQEAFAGSVFPDPDVAGDRPPRGWLYRTMRAVPGAAAMTNAAPVHIEVDVKGKRKVDDGELAIVFDNDPIDGTAFSIRVIGLVRAVFLMP